MTTPARRSSVSTADCGCTMPLPDTPLPDTPLPDTPLPGTPVLLHRTLRAGTDPATLSVFGDDVWDLTPGALEPSAKAMSLNFTSRPASFRAVTKLYFWQLINHRSPVRLWRASSTPRLSLRTFTTALPRFCVFLAWLEAHHIGSFAQVTSQHLDRFLDDVRGSERSRAGQEDVLLEVRRLWCYRSLLPEPMRLPPHPPWDDDHPRDLLGNRTPQRENATARIHPDTLQPLLMWSLRFVEDFADDIIVAFAEYQRLMVRGHGSKRRTPVEQRTSPRTVGWLTPVLREWLVERRRHGTPLPGRERPDGTREPDWVHLARIFDCAPNNFGHGRPVRDLVLDSGLPLARTACLDTPITGRFHDDPWLAEPISYVDAPRLARLLSAAAAVVIAYLSGMRPGEKRAELHWMQHSSRLNTDKLAGQSAASDQLAS